MLLHVSCCVVLLVCSCCYVCFVFLCMCCVGVVVLFHVVLFGCFVIPLLNIYIYIGIYIYIYMVVYVIVGLSACFL